MLTIKIEAQGPAGCGKTFCLKIIAVILAGLGFKVTSDFDDSAGIERLQAERPASALHKFS